MHAAAAGCVGLKAPQSSLFLQLLHWQLRVQTQALVWAPVTMMSSSSLLQPRQPLVVPKGWSDDGVPTSFPTRLDPVPGHPCVSRILGPVRPPLSILGTGFRKRTLWARRT